ncbi:hypothetical protein KUV28_17685 [Ferrimonas balearica]|nr:hypothetical protein [Ferrimonas balearica]
MLFLKPPFHLINGVAVFSDHDSEEVFHVAPGVPRMTRRLDPVTGDMVPQFQLLKYRGSAGNGGFLTFAVDLSIDDAVMDDVRDELRQMHGLQNDPILSPISFEDGDVKLMILGTQSDSADDTAPAADSDDTAEEPRFVKAVHHSKPSLYGDNNAIFSVELDADGVQLMEAALQGDTSGIGIIYALHFFALRPAYNVSVKVDWERVQTHFEERFSGQAVILKLDVSEVIDELIEDRVVEIQADTFLAEGEDSGAWVGNRDRAIQEFKDMITETFFEPAPTPEREGDDDLERGIQAAEQVGLLLASGGLSGAMSLTYRKIETTQIDRKTMNLSMSERISMRKSIYPQALLEGLLQLKDVNGQPMDLSRFVREVTLDDPWFERREVTAYALTDFEANSIAVMNVELEYDNRRETLRLTPSQGEDTADWNSRIVDGVMERDVRYSYSVEFSDVDVAERPGRVRSADLVALGDAIDIAPENDRLFFMDEIIIGTSGFPWERYPTVEVQLRYRDEANAIDLNDSLLLTQANAEQTWYRFRMDPALSSFEIRRVFHGADNSNREIGWQTIDQERIVLGDPMPSKRTVLVVPSVDWTEVNLLLVEVEYEDAENNIFESRAMTFQGATPEGQVPQNFSISLADQSKRFVRYRATIILKNGTQIRIPSSETQETFITISVDTRGHRVIEVVGPTGDFAAQGLRQVELDLAFEDAQSGLSASERLIFDRPGQVRFFEFDYAREDMRGVSATRTDVFETGLSNRHDMGVITDRSITLTFD